MSLQEDVYIKNWKSSLTAWKLLTKRQICAPLKEVLSVGYYWHIFQLKKDDKQASGQVDELSAILNAHIKAKTAH